jgi:hypothetical protein
MNYRKFNQHLAGGVYVILCAPVVCVPLGITAQQVKPPW